MTTYSIDQNLTTTSASSFDGLNSTGDLEIGGDVAIDGALNEAPEFEVSSSCTTAIGAASVCKWAVAPTRLPCGALA